MRIHISQIPPESREKYISAGLVKDDYVLAEVSKGIYGLAQAGLLAQQQLFALLNRCGFKPVSPESPCIFKHEVRDIAFSLVVDDFGVKYKRVEDAQILIDCLNELYITKCDWTGSSYIGFTISHNLVKHTYYLVNAGVYRRGSQTFWY